MPGGYTVHFNHDEVSRRMAGANLCHDPLVERVLGIEAPGVKLGGHLCRDIILKEMGDVYHERNR